MRCTRSWIAYGAAHLRGARADDYEWLARLAGKHNPLARLRPSLRELVKKDLDLLAVTMGEFEAKDVDLARRLRNAHAVSITTYRDLGFRVPSVPLKVTESFPRPYAHAALWGLTLDAQDARELSVDPGVYVRPSKAFPGLGEATVCHETAHTLFSYVESSALVRGYEEGVCDLISSLVVARLFGPDAARNVLIGLRFLVRETRDMIYRDALRQVCSHLLLVGETRWLDIVRSAQNRGRGVFLQLEHDLFRGDVGLLRESSHSQEDSTCGDGTDPPGLAASDLTRTALAMLSTADSYALSPEGFIVGKAAVPGMSLRQLQTDLAHLMTPRQFRAALRELEVDHYLMITGNGAVISNEAARYIEAGVCRYTR